MPKSSIVTELTIEGFKSFGTPPQRLPLGPLNFIVGANATGKTNLIAALRFVQNAVLRSVEFAVNEFGGIPEVRNKILREKKHPKPLAIGFKMDLTGTKLKLEKEFNILRFSYSFQLDVRSEGRLPQVELEELVADIEDESGKRLNYRLKRTKNELEIVDPTQTTRDLKQRVPEQEATRLALDVGFFSFPPVILRRIIADWRFYNISPPVARLPFKETPEVDLGPAGENLAVVLHKLEEQGGKGALDPIIAGLKSAVPGFRGVKTIQLPVEGKWAFQLVEDRIRGAINPDWVSDGTIRLLALMVIASWTAKHPSLIAIEEPENSVHPHLSEHIVQVLRTASENRQLIVTTHNPSFLDYLEPNEVILCDKVDGFTKLRHASSVSQIDTFRKHFRLGELWVQGTLGGIP